MKRAAIVLAFLLAIVAVASASVSAQEPAPVVDIGIAEPVAAACAALIPTGEEQGMVVKNCRRFEPDEFSGPNRVKVHVRIVTDQGVFLLDVTLTRSLWDIGSVIQR